MWPFSPRRQRIVLVVDDDPRSRDMLAMFFEGSGWEALQAPDGRLGLELAREKEPDLILLDIDMPLMSGTRTLALLRAEAKTAKTPVVMVTARSTLTDVEVCLKAGANDYLCKPFEIDHLRHKLERLFPTPPAA
ncbi:MAG: response regulator [Elusimicrobia bacterium]|nr:response regulator [Elusimicrobiota bacterium]